jgi:hypothetical protein
MKAIIFSLMLCLLCSLRGYSQHRSSAYKNLIGTWSIDDSTGELPSISFKFKDSTHVILTVAYEGNAHLTYTLDAMRNPMVLHFKGINADKKKMDTYWLLKILNNDTIKAEEPLYSLANDQWNDCEAITMVRAR